MEIAFSKVCGYPPNTAAVLDWKEPVAINSEARLRAQGVALV